VPAGTNLPTITFSFKPSRLSTFPLIEASVNTLVVSWKEAAEINEFVCNEAFVIPNNTLSNETGFFLSFESFSLIKLISLRSIISPSSSSESPGSLTSTYFNICLTIVSICLSFITTPCNL
jgi:hypothetical protein